MPNPVFSSHTEFDQLVIKNFNDLPQSEKVTATYVWIGGSGQDLRSKTRTLSAKKEWTPQNLPQWNFDGSSTAQAPGDNSEVILYPQAVYRDPFIRGGNNILVLCDCYTPQGDAIPSNTRNKCAAQQEKVKEQVPWYGIEQEYTLFEADGTTPFGWPKCGYPGPQGPYYCSVGTENAYGRAVMEAHYKACLYAGIEISGTNCEVMPGQWEYQVGPAVGIEGGDMLWMSRYLLFRVCEIFGVVVSLDPKPIPGDWNGAGCHTNFSTKKMREPGGYAEIMNAIHRLSKKHVEHINAYGDGNERRLTGRHETASMDTFSYGVANRGASVRIPYTTKQDGYGYFEDRRPSSNMDPYVVTGILIQTTLLDE